MAGVEKATYDYEATEDSKGFHLSINVHSPARAVMGLLFFFPVVIVGFFAMMASIDNKGMGGILVLAAIGLAFAGYHLAYSKHKTVLTITPKVLTAKGRSFDLDDVRAIGIASPGTPGMIRTGLAASAAMIGEATNQMLQIEYGTKLVTILDGLTPEMARTVYGIVVGYLFVQGRQYGDAGQHEQSLYLGALENSARMKTQKSATTEKRDPISPKKIAKTTLMVVVNLSVLGGLVYGAGLAYKEWVEEPKELAKLEEEAKKKPELQGKTFIAVNHVQLMDSLSASHWSSWYIAKGTCLKANIVGFEFAQVDGSTSDGKAMRMYAPASALARPPDGSCTPAKETFSKMKF